MALSVEELSDRAEIQDLLVLEAHALDSADWDTWEATFTPDASIDYSENDGARGRPSEVRGWLAETFATFPACQHLSSNTAITLDGDRASARTMQYIAVKMLYEGEERVVISGIWFHDRLRRTPEGWRIHERYESLSWRHNFPPSYAPPIPAASIG